MPDKPKRRKNNKNKRKNKNNRNEQKNNDVNKNANNETCSVKTSNSSLNEDVENESTSVCNPDVNINPSQEIGGESNSVLSDQDLNNNSNDIASETTQIVTEMKVLHDVVSEKENNICEVENASDSTQDINLEDINENLDESDSQTLENYVVESPEHSAKCKNRKAKLNTTAKSKSLDNDDAPKITEVLSDEESTMAIETSNALVSDVESDVEWEKVDEINEQKSVPTTKLGFNIDIGHIENTSLATIPIVLSHCDQEMNLTPESERSLRNYLHTLNLSTHPEMSSSLEIRSEIEHIINREIRHRLRKKGLTDDFLPPRPGPPRVLDVIDEESSESSLSSRRQSHLSDKKSDVEDLVDDVFIDDKKITDKYSTKSVAPMTTLTPLTNYRARPNRGRQIQQPCVLVGARIKEPEIMEARGDWTVKTVEKMSGAEVVYLTDSSSSTSSIHEYCDETDDSVDTDVSIRMLTPTIEVTDTESLLKKSFADSKNCIKSNCDFKHAELSSNGKNNKALNETYVSNENEKMLDKESFNEVGNTYYTPNKHEIVVLSTENIKTNLYVKEIGDNNVNIESEKQSKTNEQMEATNDKKQPNNSNCDLEMKVLKCEINNAFNNLIKEVESDSEASIKSTNNEYTRQDSSSSVCSSQCTAKYNPTSSSLTDVSNIMHDEYCDSKTKPEYPLPNDKESHVKDVFECVAGASSQNKIKHTRLPTTLRDLCVRKIVSLPYGDKILEELASVSKRLQNVNVLDFTNSAETKSRELVETLSTENSRQKISKMPYYPLPDVSTIEMVSLEGKHKDPNPPPVKPRNSSLKKTQDELWTGHPTKTEPVYVCLSPSQKMLMEKTNTVITKEDASDLVDMHKKFVDRRGYSERYGNGNKFEDYSNSPVIPFKSQTGSRLLALIRDPNATNNLDSKKDKTYQHHHSLDQMKKTYSEIEKMSKRINEQFSSIKEFSSSFKPIPPPRPKKYSSTFYESDESSDFTDSSFRSMKSERKLFHYSTGNLNKDIENDVSSIQNMHRYCSNIRDQFSSHVGPRRPSLPKDLCEQQMEYIRRKEKEVEAEIRRLEDQKKIASPPEKRGPRAPMVTEKEIIDEKIIDKNNYFKSHTKDTFTTNKSPEKNEKYKLGSTFSSSQEEIQRDKMYSEYMNQMAERQERKQQKVIKISSYPASSNSKTVSKSMSALDVLESKVNNKIEKEFICKARERWEKLGIKDPETEDEKEVGKDVYKEPKVMEHKIKVIEAGEETDVQKLPNHLQDFVKFTAKDKQQSSGGSAVWRPGAPTPPPAPAPAPAAAPTASPSAPPPPPPPPVWTPHSAGPSPQAPRKSFRPVNFEDTPPARRKFATADQNGCTSGSESEGRLRTSFSAPASGLNSLGGASSRLPRAQNPTVTLLQKAREGQIPKGSSYLQQERDSARLPRDRPSPPRGDPVYALRKEYASEGEASEYERGARKMADGHRRVEGIGPTTKDGMPVALRSEVKDPSKWYKKMYDTIHKNKYDDDYVTIRYKNRRGQQPQRVTNKSQYAYFDPRSGYLSEPEGGLSRLGYSTWSDAYDSDVTTGPRRRTASMQEDRKNEPASPYLPSNKYSTLASARASQEVYKNQPGRIENYLPGKSSVVDKEAKQWWDEVMDIFDGQHTSSSSLPQSSPREKKDLTSTILSKSNMARALKESGYESDSTLVFRRRDDTDGPLSPAERRAAYRDLQAGGEPPLRGFRSPAPPRQETDSAPEPPRRAPYGSLSDTESPRRYVESDVNIHYRCPVRHDPLPLVPERELARQQAEHMKRLYREQRRNKYLQEREIDPIDIEAFDTYIKELQDMQNRRHQDNFTPSQKNILPLNRYDEVEKVAARALYAFNGQTARELSFRKGDLISVRRQIDANWYEGELHGRIGLFPYNYVEILKGEVAASPRKPTIIEGRARAKFDFTAQTNLELPLKKGELVVLTRRVDQNWWEGRNGTKTGIFPDSYVTVLQEPSQGKPEPLSVSQNMDKPAASPAAHGLVNGSARRSLGVHSYTPQLNSPALSNAPPATQPLPGYVAKPAQTTLTPSERGYGPPTGAGVDLNNTEPLYVDTNAEAVPFRAMYKYRPQNPDELELNEGDTVYVLEQCDDGWYVGSSQRTGRFGTFPGNYVERI